MKKTNSNSIMIKYTSNLNRKIIMLFVIYLYITSLNALEMNNQKSNSEIKKTNLKSKTDNALESSNKAKQNEASSTLNNLNNGNNYGTIDFNSGVTENMSDNRDNNNINNNSNAEILINQYKTASLENKNSAIIDNNMKDKQLEEENSKLNNNCPKLCKQCALGECLQCDSNAYFYEGRCILICPEGTYLNKEYRTCSKCHSDCPVCWNGFSNTCGTIEGLYSVVTSLQEEVKKYIRLVDKKGLPISEKEIWLAKLNILLKNEMQENEYLKFKNTYMKKNTSDISNKDKDNNLHFLKYNYRKKNSQIYDNEVVEKADNNEKEFNYISNQINEPFSSQISLNKIEVYKNYNDNYSEIELPICSFSINNGIVILIPGYINNEGNLIPSHWVFKNGQWSGRDWNPNWKPQLPVFIKYKGDKTKIYFENNGFWYYNKNINQWSFILDNKNKNSSVSSNNDDSRNSNDDYFYSSDNNSTNNNIVDLDKFLYNMNNTKLNVRDLYLNINLYYIHTVIY